jgi:hypothetical protein
MILNAESERMHEKAVLAYSKVSLQHLPEGTEENYGNLNEGNRSSG